MKKRLRAFAGSCPPPNRSARHSRGAATNYIADLSIAILHDPSWPAARSGLPRAKHASRRQPSELVNLPSLDLAIRSVFAPRIDGDAGLGHEHIDRCSGLVTGPILSIILAQKIRRAE